MAQEMDDLEFLLPSELLTDDDLLTDFGDSCGLSSDLSSPVESLTATNETGSDLEDFVSELTRKLTHSTFLDSKLAYDHPDKGLKLSGSPQSTLCGFKHGSGDSPNSSSRVCSPPYAKDAVSFDLLYAAAEEVARVRMLEETAAFYSTGLFAPAHKPTPVTVHQQIPDPSSGFYSNQTQSRTPLSYQQWQAAKFHQIKQRQMTINGVLDQRNMDYQLHKARMDGGGDRAYGLSILSWPTLQQSQQQIGSRVKPGFLGETGPKKERVGTGVFMPRRFGSNPTETRKKPEDRVAHILNWNMNSIDSQDQNRAVGNFTTDLRPQSLLNQGFRLPQEWTY